MDHTVAIMQPYIFPYIGYFCLIQESNTFVFYDDVNYIMRGWINRNQILLNGSPYRFSIPLLHASQNDLICDVKTLPISSFKSKFLKQIEYAYKKSPFYEAGLHYIDTVLNPGYSYIFEFAIASIEKFCQYIELEDKNFLRSSQHFSESRPLPKADRLIHITQALGASRYINAIGGTSLYNKSYFYGKGISLAFVKPKLLEYKQTCTQEFISNLSIIDVIMNTDITNIKNMLQSYSLV